MRFFKKAEHRDPAACSNQHEQADHPPVERVARSKKEEPSLSSNFFESLRKKAQGNKAGREAKSNQLSTAAAKVSSKFSEQMRQLRAGYRVAAELRYKPQVDPRSIEQISLLAEPRRKPLVVLQSGLSDDRQRAHTVETSETLIEINAKIADL